MPVPVRVITTHLEYYGTRKRTAQVEALRRIYSEGSEHARLGRIVDTTGGPFHTRLRPQATIITGDFNLEPDDPLHARMCASFDDGTPPLVDAWEAAEPGKAAPGHFQDLREGDGRTSPSCIAISSSCRPTSRRGSGRCASISKHRPPITSRC